MKEQLDRIEEKLDEYAKQTAAHGADIAWLKRFVGAAGGLLTLIAGAMLRKFGFGSDV
jgi:hypothetical protein